MKSMDITVDHSAFTVPRLKWGKTRGLESRGSFEVQLCTPFLTFPEPYAGMRHVLNFKLPWVALLLFGTSASVSLSSPANACPPRQSNLTWVKRP